MGARFELAAIGPDNSAEASPTKAAEAQRELDIRTVEEDNLKMDAEIEIQNLRMELLAKRQEAKVLLAQALATEAARMAIDADADKVCQSLQQWQSAVAVMERAKTQSAMPLV